MELKDLLVKPQILLENPEEVRLIDKDAIATGKTTISYEAIDINDIDVEKAKGLLKRLILPGHLTPFLNRNIVFRIQGISRTASTWLHHRTKFYNTGQYSQRYLKLSKEDDIPPIFLPKSVLDLPLELQQKILDFFIRRNNDYKNIMNIYGKELVKRHSVDDFEKAKNITTQYARDIYPSAVFTALRHGTNIIQLGRLFLLADDLNFDMPEDAREVVLSMWNLVKNENPYTCKAIEEVYHGFSVPETERLRSPNADWAYGYFHDFMSDNLTKLHDNNLNEQFIKELMILGLKTNHKSSESLLYNLNNDFFKNAFGMQSVSILGKALNNIMGFGFFTSMSHSTFEQSVRHRTINHNVNLELPVFLSKPSYVLPAPFKDNSEIKGIFDQAFLETWRLKEELLYHGLKPSEISYFLPRATEFIVSVSGSFNDIRHYITLRSCASAQFNIYLNTVDLIKEIEKRYNLNKGIFGPKCFFAKKCVEGPRSCGLNPWLMKDLNQFLEGRYKKGY